jgi:hypothetical protein
MSLGPFYLNDTVATPFDVDLGIIDLAEYAAFTSLEYFYTRADGTITTTATTSRAADATTVTIAGPGAISAAGLWNLNLRLISGSGSLQLPPVQFVVETPTDALAGITTAADLAAYTGAQAADSEFVQECYLTAKALVDTAMGSATVPGIIIGRAYLEAGSELFHRRQAPNGIAQFADFNGPAIRVARDPMVGVWPILRPYLGGIA